MNLPRVLVIDLWRALAILLVVNHHGPNKFFLDQSPIQLVLEKILWFGHTGVDLFFVLSGYLITNLLLTEFEKYETVDVGRFLLRRFWKLYPPYIVLSLVTLFMFRGYDLGQLFRSLLFLNSYLQDFWSHTWSIAIEAHFYLLMAGIVWLDLKRGVKSLTKLFLARALLVVLVVPLSRGLTELFVTTNGIYYFSHYRLDGFFIGVGIASLQFSKIALLDRIANKYWLPVAFLGLSILILSAYLKLPKFGFLYAVFGLGLPAVGYGVLFWLTLCNCKTNVWLEKRRFLKALSYIGQASYSIYLWHILTRHLLIAFFGENISQFLLWILYLACSLLIGILSYEFIERTSLALRDRRKSSRARITL